MSASAVAHLAADRNQATAATVNQQDAARREKCSRRKEERQTQGEREEGEERREENKEEMGRRGRLSSFEETQAVPEWPKARRRKMAIYKEK